MHSSFFGNVASSYCCWLVQLISWLVICVPRVACDFVSRLGGWDAIFFLKGRLIEPFLGGPLFWLRCSSRRHGYLVPLSSAHGTRLWFDTRRSLSSGPGPDASKQLAVRDGYLTAVSQLKHVPAHAVIRNTAHRSRVFTPHFLAARGARGGGGGGGAR